MIISQLALCEECRDGSCRACRNFKRRQARLQKYKLRVEQARKKMEKKHG